jgi:predicted O-linked N-acetylglucosamine transferase (SPINDLY family)
MVPRMRDATIEQAIAAALMHHQGGRLAEAEALYRQVLAQDPAHGGALHLLGLVAGQTGRTEVAIDLMERAIAVAPGVAEYHSNLGEAYRQAGRLEEAIAHFRRALELKPALAHVAHVLSNLGNALKDAGRLEEAITALARAAALLPGEPAVQKTLGVALHAAGRLDEAIAAYQGALGRDPDDARTLNNLGLALHEMGRHYEAIVTLGRAIALDPGLAEAHSNLGNALSRRGRLDEALAALGRAVALQPGLAVAHNNLGTVYREQGRLDLALASFRKAQELDPGLARAASNVLFTIQFHPDYDAARILAAHREWARRYAEPLDGAIRPHSNDPTPDRALRVGFISPDFREHPVGRLLLPLFAHFDRRHVESVGYSDVRAPDAITRQLATTAGAWRNVAGLSDRQLAEQVRVDRIDVLVDLTLHTAGNRMLAFARKPAPVQVTMLGLPGTTGLATVEYRLTDAVLDPPGETDGDYVEQSVRLPHCFWCYQPPVKSPPAGPLPAQRNGFVTFGCLNQHAKTSRAALELWVEVLQAVPGARLFFHAHPGAHREDVRAVFKRSGIDPDRIEFTPQASFLEYLECHRALDLALDPFPYNGGVTTMDALWMGVPVVTLAGRTAVGRAGASILTHARLPEMIARTPRQYVEIAAAWAADRARLEQLRSQLRAHLERSPLLDARQYASDVEEAFRRMWRTWCNR